MEVGGSGLYSEGVTPTTCFIKKVPSLRVNLVDIAIQNYNYAKGPHPLLSLWASKGENPTGPGGGLVLVLLKCLLELLLVVL